MYALSLEQQLEMFWKIEATTDGKGLSQNDLKALEEWKEGITTENGHYQLPIPFRHRPPSLNNNYQVAEKRLQSLKSKLDKEDDLRQKYKEGMADLLEKGFAEEVRDEDCIPEGSSVWYIPHHPVLHAMKPGKARIVFDCASTWKGVCPSMIQYYRDQI